MAFVLLRNPDRQLPPPTNIAGAAQVPAPQSAFGYKPILAAKVAHASQPDEVRVGSRGGEARLDFQVLVPKGQIAAAFALSDAVNARRVDGEKLLALSENSARGLEVKALEIAPLPPLRADSAESMDPRESSRHD
jgi:hypothetical protein